MHGSKQASYMQPCASHEGTASGVPGCWKWAILAWALVDLLCAIAADEEQTRVRGM